MLHNFHFENVIWRILVEQITTSQSLKVFKESLKHVNFVVQNTCSIKKWYDYFNIMY